jgi:hypothetical protein
VNCNAPAPGVVAADDVAAPRAPPELCAMPSSAGTTGLMKVVRTDYSSANRLCRPLHASCGPWEPLTEAEMSSRRRCEGRRRACRRPSEKSPVIQSNRRRATPIGRQAVKVPSHTMNHCNIEKSQSGSMDFIPVCRRRFQGPHRLLCNIQTSTALKPHCSRRHPVARAGLPPWR